MAQIWPDLLVSKTQVRRAGETLRRWFVGELVSETDVEEHAWADLVESLGRRTGHRLKQGIGPDWLLQSLADLSETYAELDSAITAGDSTAEVTAAVDRQRSAIEDELGGIS